MERDEHADCDHPDCIVIRAVQMANVKVLASKGVRMPGNPYDTLHGER